MDQKVPLPADSGYKGDSPRWAAIKEFFFSGIVAGVGLDVALDLGFVAAARRRGETMVQYLRRDRWTSGLLVLETAVGTLFGLYQANKAYDNARRSREQYDMLTRDNATTHALLSDTKKILSHVSRDQHQHDTLVADNVAMRRQLNETGQVLQHVAKQVEKGEMQDSKLSLNHEAPPTHVARVQAARGQQALDSVMHQNVHPEKHAPQAIHFDSHAEHINADKAYHDTAPSLH